MRRKRRESGNVGGDGEQKLRGARETLEITSREWVILEGEERAGQLRMRGAENRKEMFLKNIGTVSTFSISEHSRHLADIEQFRD
jgi:hypothetical protein